MKNIFLLGYMGSGKSTMGKELAMALHKDFIDLDRVIEIGEKTTIADIFELKGEEYFRKIERIYLLQIARNDNSIIALGGGTPCYFDNMDIINANGLSVYLKVPAFILQQRLQDEKSLRPLINGMDEFELYEFIQQQIGERERYYLKAHRIINTINISKLVEIATKN